MVLQLIDRAKGGGPANGIWHKLQEYWFGAGHFSYFFAQKKYYERKAFTAIYQKADFRDKKAIIRDI